MLHFSPVKKAMILLTVLFGFFLALPNLLSEGQRNALPSFMPTEQLRLGLDLQGGAQVLVSAQMDEVFEKRMKTLAIDVRRVLREAGNIKRGTPVVGDDSVTVRIRDAADLDRARVALNELPQPLQSGAITGINSNDLEITLDETRQAFTLTLTEAAKGRTDGSHNHSGAGSRPQTY